MRERCGNSLEDVSKGVRPPAEWAKPLYLDGVAAHSPRGLTPFETFIFPWTKRNAGLVRLFPGRLRAHRSWNYAQFPFLVRRLDPGGFGRMCPGCRRQENR